MPRNPISPSNVESKANDIEHPASKKLRPSSSSAMMEAKLNPPLKITMISWNMANQNGSVEDLQLIINTMKMQNHGKLPDIIIIATQEEGRHIGKEYLCDQINAEFTDPYHKDIHSFTTMTKPGAFGRVSLTVLTDPALGKVDLQWKEVQALNKGGVGCEVSVNGHHFSFSGMHLDSNQDNLKVKIATTMVTELEGETQSNHHISYQTMERHSTELDVIMGDLNHRHVITDYATHYDPLGNSSFGREYTTSAARYGHALGFKPAPDEDEQKGHQAAITYQKKDHHSDIESPNKLRVEGATKAPCLQKGTLDRILVSGTVQITPVIVIESTSSDHNPIIATITTTRAQNDFQRTKEWVIRKIEHFASEDVVSTLKSLIDTPSNKLHLETVFNYYKYVRDLTMQAEEFRLRKDRGGMQYAVLLGGTGSESELSYRETIQQTLARSPQKESMKRQGLVQQMIENGNYVFQNKDYLSNPAKFNDLKLSKPQTEKDNRHFIDESYKNADKLIEDIAKLRIQIQHVEYKRLDSPSNKWSADEAKPQITDLRSRQR